MKYIPGIVVAASMLCFPLAQAQAELSPEDAKFLQTQCKVIEDDVKAVPSLSSTVQTNVARWVAAKDCKKLTPLKDTRSYYRKLKPGQKLPTPPATWDFDYLTDQEFLNYVEILNKAPL